jgi:hypothetical protein
VNLRGRDERPRFEEIMKEIWKQLLPIQGVRELQLPEDATLLHVDGQYEAVMLWVLVDPDAKREVRKFTVVFTGQTLPDDFDDHNDHVGTVLLDDGNLVSHVFETFE